MAELHQLTAAELSECYRTRALSPVEVTRAVLARIAACEPKLNAMYLVHDDEALATAVASEARWASGAPLSPLDGVPITIKDNVVTRGTPTPFGTAASDTSVIASADSPPAARVREAGCVIVGKTTMPDLGMLGSGLSTFHGTTRNPWNLERNPGGSSSGAGAGLAAGYGPLAIGTDIGGSVRLPASFCGVFALKPSLGRVPTNAPYLGRVTGPMTRTVTDAAMLMEILARPDPGDFMSLPYDQPVPYAARLRRQLTGVRLGLVLDIGVGLAVDPEVRTAVERAAGLFADTGAIVEPVPPIVTPELMQGVDLLFRARSLATLLDIPPERRQRMLPFITTWCVAAERYSAVELARALAAIFTIRQRCIDATLPYDFLLSPTVPIPPFGVDEPCPGSDPDRPFEHVGFTAPFNQSEQPACSINCGYTRDGLPIGLQIVGHRFDDLGVLQLARAFEQLRPTQRRWPEP